MKIREFSAEHQEGSMVLPIYRYDYPEANVALGLLVIIQNYIKDSENHC
jgi:hypothetical protein